MAATLTWFPDPASNGVTEYILDSSTDGTITWANVTTVVYSLTGMQYDKVNKVFTYTDSAGAPGTLYRLSAVGSFGTSGYVYIAVPPGPPPVCEILGYIQTAMAGVDSSTPIQVQTYLKKGQQFFSVPGTIGQTRAGMGIQAWKTSVYPNASGICSDTLVQGVYALITIPALNFRWAFQVPEVPGPVNIRDIPCLKGSDWFSVTGEETGVPENEIATGL